MADMPKRPRSHVLETESLARVNLVLSTAGWAVQTLSPDYGLDQRVEIFDHGAATGLAFFTQVKATDEPDLQKALGVSFDSSTLNYFGQVDEPVLLVRYHSPTATLYGRWFHRIDDRASDSATKTIRFAEDGTISASDLDSIRHEVRLFRSLRSARPAWPLDVRIGSNVEELSAHDLAVACTAAAGRQRFVRFTAEPTDSEGLTGSVEINGDGLLAHFGVASVTLHGDPGDEVDQIAHDILFAVGLALGVADQHGAANRLMMLGIERSAAAGNNEAVLAATTTLSRSGDVQSILSIGRTLLDRGYDRAAEVLVPFALLPVRDMLDDGVGHDVSEFYDRLTASLTSGDPSAGAGAAYSSANWRWSQGEYDEALARYERAAELDPEYLGRLYYLAEVAAAHFELDEFEAAADWYRRALQQSPNDGERARLLPRLGDCLLHSGKFAEAVAAFEACEADPSEPIWFFKAFAANQLAMSYGDEQQRRPEEARELAARAMDLGDSEEAASLANEALKLDPLCGEAWWVLGRYHVNDGRLAEGFPALLIAIGQGGDAVSWSEVFLVATTQADEPTITTIIRAAFTREGHAFVDAVRKALATAPPEVRRGVLGEIGTRISDLQAEAPVTFRLHAAGGTDELRV